MGVCAGRGRRAAPRKCAAGQTIPPAPSFLVARLLAPTRPNTLSRHTRPPLSLSLSLSPLLTDRDDVIVLAALEAERLRDAAADDVIERKRVDVVAAAVCAIPGMNLGQPGGAVELERERRVLVKLVGVAVLCVRVRGGGVRACVGGGGVWQVGGQGSVRARGCEGGWAGGEGVVWPCLRGAARSSAPSKQQQQHKRARTQHTHDTLDTNKHTRSARARRLARRCKTAGCRCRRQRKSARRAARRETRTSTTGAPRSTRAAAPRRRGQRGAPRRGAGAW